VLRQLSLNFKNRNAFAVEFQDLANVTTLDLHTLRTMSATLRALAIYRLMEHVWV
jgi:hypothetical protein